MSIRNQIEIETTDDRARLLKTVQAKLNLSARVDVNLAEPSFDGGKLSVQYAKDRVCRSLISLLYGELHHPIAELQQEINRLRARCIGGDDLRQTFERIDSLFWDLDRLSHGE